MVNPSGRPGFHPAVEALEPRFLLAGDPSHGAANSPVADVEPPGPGYLAGDDRYVVLHETDRAHPSPATAQRLPDLPYTGVVGSLGAGDTVDVYRIPVDPETATLQFALTWEAAPGTAAPLVMLLDGAGRVLGAWPATLDVKANPSELEIEPARGSDLFIGIAPGGNASTGGASVDYQLWVNRGSATESPGPGANDAPGPTGGTVTSPGPALGTLADLARPSGNGHGPQPEARMADGPAPTLSAGPSVGQFAEDRAAPEHPGMIATINLRWPGDHPLEPTAEPPAEDGARIGSVREHSDSTLVAVNGPGGSPLLEADAIDERLLRPIEARPGPGCGDAAGSTIADLDARTPESGMRPEAHSNLLVRIPDAGFRIRDLAAAWTLNVVLADPAIHDALVPRRPSGPRRSRDDERRSSSDDP